MFWLGLIVSLCYVPGITGAYIATQWPVLAVLLPFGLWRSGPFTLFHVLGLLFVAYAAAGILWSPAPYSSVYGFWLICIMGLSVWFGTTLTAVRGLYAGLAAGAAVSSAVGVAQHFGLDLVPRVTMQPAGLYVNSVQQGMVIALLTVALVSERMWFWVLPLIPGLALANSRGAWLALVVGLLGCGIRRTWVLGAVAIAGAFYLIAPLGVSDVQRMLVWQTAWQNLTWLGWGPGVFFTILIPQNGGMFYPEFAHNDALQLLFEYGAGAFLPLAIFAFAVFRTASKEWPVVLASVAAGCYSMPLWAPITSFLFLVAVGRILRGYALDGSNRDDCRRHVVSRQRHGNSRSRGTLVSVASHH